METSERVVTVPVESPTSFLQWSAVIAGALVASALSLVLIAFGSAIGLSIVSTSPTWRDASPALALLSGLFLLLAALLSFGCGGYVAGRLRARWSSTAPIDVVEFRDGTHGVVAWALAIVITGLLAVASTGSTASRVAPLVTATGTTAAIAGEPLIAYELDRLFRGAEQSDIDLSYTRAEAGRILLRATGRRGASTDDLAYLAQLVAGSTGVGQPEADRRVDNAIVGAKTAVRKARRTAVILGFSAAVSLLVGAAAAWLASCLGGRHRDEVAPSLSWHWRHTPAGQSGP